MRQSSLWSRFQGVVYGGLLGEKLAITTEERRNQLSQIRMIFFDHLIHSRTFQWDLKETEQEIIKDLTLSEIGVLLVPIILFFHENPSKLSQHLDSVGLHLEKTQANIEILKHWSKIIALALRGSQWDESCLFQLGEQEPAGEGRILLSSLKCFDACRDDLRLSFLSTHRLEGDFPLITALTGILLGAYNGRSSFPVSWRLIIQSEQHREISILSRFFGAWCGVNSPDQRSCWDVTAVL